MFENMELRFLSWHWTDGDQNTAVLWNWIYTVNQLNANTNFKNETEPLTLYTLHTR